MSACGSTRSAHVRTGPRRSAEPAPRPRGRGRVHRARSRPRLPRGRARAGGRAAARRPAVRMARRRVAARVPAAGGRPHGVPARRSTDASCRTRRTRCARPARSATSRSSNGREYEPPAWLDSVADAGPTERLEIRCRRLVARVHVLLYATPDPPGLDAPLLVAHDGPEYANYSGLTRFLDVMSWEERIPPLRAALIQPVDRNETYSASAIYAAALARELLPEISKRVPHKRRIGMGASLGGARDAPRAPPSSEALRRPAPAVGQLLPAAIRQAGEHVPALPADHAVHRHGAPRARRRAADPGRDHVRNGRGEPLQQRGGRGGAPRPGLPGVARRTCATRTTGRAGATRSTRTCRR